MIAIHLYRDGRPSDETVGAERVSDLIGDGSVMLWLDVTEPTDDDLATLQREFSLHPLTMEDVRHRHQRPKVELFKDYAFVVLRAMHPRDAEEPKESEVHAFVGPRFLVTIRYDPAYDMQNVVRRWERQPELMASGGGFATYVLIDEIVDDFLTLVERMEDRADDLEDRIFADPGDTAENVAIQQALFGLKRTCIQLRRFVTPLREGIDLLEEQPDLVPAPLDPYYRDVMDHVIRTVELVDNIRDLLTSMLDVRIAQVANHLNEVMKKLTAWAGIILVPTFIAGVYGMNFESMPELHWHLGYPLVLGVMAASALILYRMFKKREWL
jgi:magnesium transporter